MAIADSLITRYRPKVWSDVVGQEQVVNSLKTIIEKKDSHAYLFIGPSGVGKTTLARICASKLGCTRPIEIDAATYSGVDDVRAITQTLMYRPLDTEKTKAIIIDEAHSLSKSGIQALLKSIEEPPEHAFFFLCTTEGARILDTIKTRCTIYNLKPVSTNKIFDLLHSVALNEGLEISNDVLDLCAQEAYGSPRAALSYLAVCSVAKDRAEAASLLRSAEESPGAIALCRALSDGLSWDKIRPILIDLQDTNPESIRHTVRGYFSKVALNSNKNPQQALAILDAFREPFNASDGLTPVILAVAGLVL